MSNGHVRIVAIVMATALVPPLSAQTKINLPALMGKTRAELRQVFPGGENTLRNWNGWKAVHLFFNGKARLGAVNFEPTSPMSEAQAETVIREMGIRIERQRYFAAPAVHGYRNMSGLVRTVNFTIQGGRVTDIGGILQHRLQRLAGEQPGGLEQSPNPSDAPARPARAGAR